MQEKPTRRFEGFLPQRPAGFTRHFQLETPGEYVRTPPRYPSQRGAVRERKVPFSLKGRVPLGELCRRIWKEIDEDNCTGWAAQMSYYFVAALFPFFVFLAALVGFLPLLGSWHGIVTFLVRYLPGQSWLVGTVMGLTQHRNSFLSVGVLGTAWSASTGIMSLMESLNAAYEARETRGYLKRRALALLILLLLSLLVLVSFVVVTVGHYLIHRFAGQAAGFSNRILWEVGGWTVSLVLIGLAAVVADYALPNVKRPWQWVTPGSVFVMAAWALSSLGFDYYVRYVGSYSKTYGALGGLMILMLWIYVINLIILVGAEVNSELHKVQFDEARPAEPGPGLPRMPQAEETREGS